MRKEFVDTFNLSRKAEFRLSLQGAEREKLSALFFAGPSRVVFNKQSRKFVRATSQFRNVFRGCPYKRGWHKM